MKLEKAKIKENVNEFSEKRKEQNEQISEFTDKKEELESLKETIDGSDLSSELIESLKGEVIAELDENKNEAEEVEKEITEDNKKLEEEQEKIKESMDANKDIQNRLSEASKYNLDMGNAIKETENDYEELDDISRFITNLLEDDSLEKVKDI